MTTYNNFTALEFAAREYCRTRPELLKPLMARIAFLRRVNPWTQML